MVKETEEYAEEDKKVKERIDSRNNLQTLICNMKSTINDEDELGNKIDSEEKEAIQKALKDALTWMVLDDNQSSEKEEHDDKIKELEAIYNPIINKAYDENSSSTGNSFDSEDDSHNELHL